MTEIPFEVWMSVSGRSRIEDSCILESLICNGIGVRIGTNVIGREWK